MSLSNTFNNNLTYKKCVDWNYVIICVQCVHPQACPQDSKRPYARKSCPKFYGDFKGITELYSWYALSRPGTSCDKRKYNIFNS